MSAQPNPPNTPQQPGRTDQEPWQAPGAGGGEEEE